MNKNRSYLYYGFFFPKGICNELCKGGRTCAARMKPRTRRNATHFGELSGALEMVWSYKRVSRRLSPGSACSSALFTLPQVLIG
ncbi:hypothetical protein MATL_G00220420 [Megalops atlanticus]|uniref:Uncharacterized protein n=1 Tax=Megalops atlanticus TaxID=7932 RepID=A0A9D3SW76_MEGAT|nr:hypothetical protein MATL_G00220420 [Megalops atlanticus]